MMKSLTRWCHVLLFWLTLLLCCSGVWLLKATEGHDLSKDLSSLSIRCLLEGSQLKCPDKSSLAAFVADNNLLDEVKSLELSNCDLDEITAVHISQLTKLQSLKLKNITMLHTLVLPAMTSLRHLDLSGCGIQYFNKEFLRNFNNLETLDLSHNELTSFSQDHEESFQKLKELNLHGNPLQCDCSILWLLKCLSSFRQRRSLSTPVHQHSVCASPAHLKGRHIDSLHLVNDFTTSCLHATEHHVRLRRDTGGLVWSCTQRPQAPRVILFTVSRLSILSSQDCITSCRLSSSAAYYAWNNGSFMCHCGDAKNPVFNDSGCKLRCVGNGNHESDGCNDDNFITPSDVAQVNASAQYLVRVVRGGVYTVTLHETNQSLATSFALSILYLDPSTPRLYVLKGPVVSIVGGRVVVDTNRIVLPVNISVTYAYVQNASTGTISWRASNGVSLPVPTMTTCQDHLTYICSGLPSSSVVSLFSYTSTGPMQLQLSTQYISPLFSVQQTVNLTYEATLDASSVVAKSLVDPFVALQESVAFYAALNTNRVSAVWQLPTDQTSARSCSPSCPGHLSANECSQVVSSCFFAQNVTFTVVQSYTIRLKLELSQSLITTPFSLNWNVVVQRKISFVKIVPLCSSEIVANETKRFKAETDGTSVIFQWFVDGVQKQDGGSVFSHGIRSVKEFSVQVYAQNNVSNFTVARNLSTLSAGYIHGLSFTAQQTAIAAGDVKCFSPPHNVFTLTARQSTLLRGTVCGGSDIQAFWSFGDGNNAQGPITTPQNKTYDNIGLYTAILFANNSLNNVTSSKTIAVYAPITYLKVNFTKLVARTNEPLVILVDSTPNANSCLAQKKGGHQWVTHPLDNGSTMINLSFTTAGKYKVCIEVQNPVSRMQECATYVIQEVIKLQWRPRNSSAVNVAVSFIPIRVSGTNISYRWDYGDGNKTQLKFHLSEPLATNHVFTREGDFNVTLLFYNNVTTETALHHVIRIENSIKGFHIEHPKYAGVNHVTHFGLVFPLSTIFHYTYIGFMSGTAMATKREQRVLISEGEKYINVTAFNNVSSVISITKLIVQSVVSNLSFEPRYIMQNVLTLLQPSSEGTNVSFTIEIPNRPTLSGSNPVYSFSQTGKVILIVTAENQVSRLSKDFPIDVEVNLALVSLSINASVQVAVLNEATHIVTGLSPTTEISFIWSVYPDDGHIISESEQGAVVIFTRAGIHRIHLSMSNNVSNTTIVKDILVQEAIGDVRIVHNGTLYEDRQVLVVAVGTSQLVANISRGSGLTYSWKLGGFVVSQQNEATIASSVADVRSLEVTVVNNISRKSIRLTVEFLKPIEQLTVTTNGSVHVNESQFASSTDAVPFEAMVNGGDNATYAWWVGSTERQRGPSPRFMWRFELPGIYNVSVTVSSPVSPVGVSVSQIVISLAPVSNLTVSPLEVLVGNPTQLNASVATGSSVMYMWNSSGISFSGNPFVLNATSEGQHVIHVTAYNFISSISMPVIVAAKPVLADLKLSADLDILRTNGSTRITVDSPGNAIFSWLVNDDLVQKSPATELNYTFDAAGSYSVAVRATNGLSVSPWTVFQIDVLDPPIMPYVKNCCVDPFQTNSTVRLTGGVQSGTNVTFLWTVNLPGQPQFQQVRNYIEFAATEPGIGRVEVRASNAVDNISSLHIITIIEAINGLKLWSSQEIVPLGEEVNFQALTTSGSDVNYTWFLNDSRLAVNNADNITLNFNSLGNHTVMVEVINGLLSQPLIRSTVISVLAVACPPPILSIQGSPRRRMTMSSWLYAEAKIDFNCTAYSPASSWTFRLAKTNTRCQFDHSTLEAYALSADEVVMSSPLLAVPPGMFDVGVYCVLYSMVYGVTGQYERIIAMHLTVVSTPLVPQIVGGNKRKFSISDNITIDGWTTIDPDLKPNQTAALEFKFHSNYVNASIHAPSTIRLNTNWSNKSSVELPSGNILPGLPYLVEMSVRRIGSKNVERTSQTIVTAIGNVSLVMVTCITCQAYKTLKYTPSRQLKLSGACTNCEGFDEAFFKYKWLVLDQNGTEVSLGSNNTETGLESSLLVVNAGVLDGQQDYEFQLTLQLGAAVGQSSVTLFPNTPPRNGSCTLAPLVGVSFETMFTFECDGWEDDDNVDTPFLTWVIADSAVGRGIVYRGIQSSVASQLPLGHVDANRTVAIIILIEDALGALTVAFNGTCQVLPPSDRVDVDDFLGSKIDNELIPLSKAQDSNKLLALVQASSALLTNCPSTTTIGKRDKVLSRIVELSSASRSSSLEGIEQIASTIDVAVSSCDKALVNAVARLTLTTSLESIVAKLSRFASGGIPAGDVTTKSLFQVFSNNFDGLNTLAATSNTRVRRDTTVEAGNSALLQSTGKSLQAFYLLLLQTTSLGEKAKELTSANINSRLHRSAPKDVLTNISRSGCQFVKDIGLLNNYPEIFEVFESSAVNQYSSDITNFMPTSQLCSLSFFQPDKTEIAVDSLPDGETVEIAMKQRYSSAVASNSTVELSVSSGSVKTGRLNLTDVSAGEAVHVEVAYVANMTGSLLLEVMLKENGTQSNSSIVVESKIASDHGGLYSFFISETEFNPDGSYSVRVTSNYTEAVALSVTVFTSSCLYWNTTSISWDHTGCYVSNASSRELTKCHCDHLTSFSAILEVKPNAIDFSLLFELDIAENPVALATVCGVIFVFFIILLLSYRIDEKERRHEHFIPFLGPEEFFKYEIKVTTGGHIGAGTTARVGIQMFGRRAKTKSRMLFKEGGLQRNSVDIFQFAAGKGLGNIYKIRVWHDNSGNDPSWYVKSIIIKNMLDGRKYFFFCSSWLALDVEGGVIEKDFTVASKQMIRQFSLIFDSVVGRAFHDYHLWLSVIQRPTLSSFTRVQRVACCVTLVLSYMAINAMWFGVAPDGRVDLFLGFRGFSYEEIIIGVVSSLMVFPLNICLVMLFRKSKPRVQHYDDVYGEVSIYKIKGRRRYSLESIEVDDLRKSVALLSATSLRRCKTKINLGSFRMPLLHPDNSYYAVLPDNNMPGYEDAVAIDSNVDAHPQRRRRSSGLPPHRLAADIDFETPLMPEPPADNEDTLIGRTKTNNEQMAENFELFCRAVANARHMSEAARAAEASREPGTVQSISNSAAAIMSPETEQEMHRLFDQFNARSESGSATPSSESEAEEAVDAENNVRDRKYLDEMDDLPNVYERPANMHGPLPSWCSLVAYFLCLAISGFSIVLILIYGQQFGRDKAVKWVIALLVGLVQDIFITYPFVLVTGAAILALIIKPTNLDYSDFVECPVVPRNPKLEDNIVAPLRGLALQSAQREGLRKHRLRVILKRAAFLLVFGWLLLSVFITSFNPTTAGFGVALKDQLNNGSVPFSDLKNSAEYWAWSEDTLMPFLQKHSSASELWGLSSAVQFRQLRLGNASCGSASPVTCHVTLQSDNAQTNNVDGNWSRPLPPGASAADAAWSYTIHGGGRRSFVGSYQSYDTDRGYTYTLPSDFGTAKNKLVSLQHDGWIDNRSSAVFVEFLLHNRNNSDTYAVVTLLMETSLSGFIFSRMDIHFVVTDLYTISLDYFRLVCEVGLGLMMAYLCFSVVMQLRKRGSGVVCRRVWFWHLLLLCLSSVTYVALAVWRVILLALVRSDLEDGFPVGKDPALPAAVESSVVIVLGVIALLVIVKFGQLFSWLRNYFLISYAYGKALGYLFVTFFFLVLVAVGFTSYGYVMFNDSYSDQANPFDSLFGRLLMAWESETRWRYSTYHNIYGIVWNIIVYSMYTGVLLVFLSALLAALLREFHLAYPRQMDDRDRMLFRYLWMQLHGKSRDLSSAASSGPFASASLSTNQGVLFTQSGMFSSRASRWYGDGNKQTRNDVFMEERANADREEIRRDEFFNALHRQVLIKPNGGLHISETPL